MFSFFFKRAPKVLQDFSLIGTDMHSHLIPGIDDGADTVETSVALVKELVDLGFKRIITTPHVMSDHYPNSRDVIMQGAETVRQALKAEGINVPFTAAAEYFMDDTFIKLMESEPLLTLHKNYILVEMSMLSPLNALHDYLFRMELKGYHPVLAHPERYLYYHKDYEAYEDLRDKGVLFQVNALSLIGYYGEPVMKIAHRLVKDNLVDLIGTDTHHVRHLNFWREHLGSKSLQSILSKYAFQNASIFG